MLVTPYDSLLAIATTRFPFLPVSWLLRDRYESSRYAPVGKCCKLGSRSMARRPMCSYEAIERPVVRRMPTLARAGFAG